jgi:hypothetical protein
MSAAGASVSSADDPEQASAEVEAAIAFILAGLRQQAESGGDLGLSAQAAAPADGQARGHAGSGSRAAGSRAGGQAPPAAHLE